MCFSRVLELKGSQLIGKADIVHNLTSTALLLMPLFKSGTLHDALQRRAARNEPFSNQEALRLFLQVSANMESTHSASLWIRRDIILRDFIHILD